MSDEPYLVTDSPKEIWLEPQCGSGSGTERRCWSSHDPGECEDCKSPSVRYIRADLHEALDAENKLREQLDAVSAAICSSRWMDPPDGGDVSLAEQVRRMADENKRLRIASHLKEYRARNTSAALANKEQT